MIKTELIGTLEKYEIKSTPGGKVAKFTFACKVEYEPGLTPIGIDFQEFDPEGTTKEKVFQNIPLLTEIMKIQLWDRGAKEAGELAAHTFDNITVEKAKVVQIKLDSDSDETEPVAKIVFSTWATRDLNDWLFINLMDAIAMRLTQKVKQETLDFDNNNEMSAEAQGMAKELDEQMPKAA